MTLEYKILWIDNYDKIYQDHQTIIEDHLTNLGFTPVIEKGVDYNAFDKFKGNLQQFDLFLLDYKLDGDKNGNEIIKDIREENYTDVIFYSTLPDEVRQKIYDDKLNGVYYTSRDFEQFEDDVISIIDVTIKKVQDVNNLRGLIMAEVAELDRIKNRIVKKYCEITKNTDNELKKYIKTDVFNDFKSNLEKYDFLISEDKNSHEKMKLHEFIDDLIYMSTKKSLTVFKIKRLFEPTKLLNFKHDNYYKEVIKKRNVFAHDTEKEDAKGKYLNYPNGERLDFTEEECVKIRKDIKKHKELLEEIEQKLNG